jgi:hypothetical protein
MNAGERLAWNPTLRLARGTRAVRSSIGFAGTIANIQLVPSLRAQGAVALSFSAVVLG